MKKNKIRNIAANILLFLGALILIIILVEIAVRVFDIAPQYGTSGMFESNELLDYKMRADFTGRFAKQEVNMIVHTNSDGLRDEEYNGKKPNDFNILALGDSFAWGAYGTELNETYAKLLEKKLNENFKGKNYRVINAGVPGYGTDQEFLYLKNYGMKFEPDMALLSFFVGNDFFDNMQSGEFIVKNNILVPNRLEQNWEEKFRRFLTLHLHSYRIMEKGAIKLFGNLIINTIGKNIQYDEKEFKLFKTPIDEQAKSQFEKTEQILTEMNSYSKSKNIRLVVVIIPLNYQADEGLKQSFISNFGKNTEFDMEQPQKVIMEWAKKSKVDAIDLAPELSVLEKNDTLYWRFNGHFNAKGNEEVANIIYENLMENRLVKD